VLAVCVGFFVFLRGDSALQDGAQSEWLMAAVAFAAVALAVHECCHALVARMLRFQVVEIRVGTGPRLFRRQLGAICVDLRLVPSFGYVRYLDDNRGHIRARSFAVTVAGPIGTFLTTAAFIAFASDPWKFAALVTGTIQLISTLVPYDYEREGRPVRSDGGKLLDLLRKTAL
jgi:membrane-associated protease RseP (regulator of RpoE activity)